MLSLNWVYRQVKKSCPRCLDRSHLSYIIGCRYRSSGNILKSPYPEISLPDIPLHRYIWQNIHKWPNHTAVECAVSGKKYSYRELELKCRRFSSSLHKIGFKKGENIMIYLPNIPEYPIALFGAMKGGLISFTFNAVFNKDELLYYVNNSDSRLIVCHPSNVANVQHVKQHLNKELKIICTNDLKGNWPKQCEEVIKFEELVNDHVDHEGHGDTDTNLSDDALTAYSSGTTGLAKGVCLTHRSITANIAQFSSPPINKFMETHGNHQEVIPGVLPFFHVYGSVIILAAGLRHGSKIITLPTYNNQQFLSILENNSNINLFLVPPLLFFLSRRQEVKGKHLNGVREIMLGAAPCGADDLNQIRSKINHDIRISQAYGLTESSPLLTININEGMNESPSSVGKLLSNTYSKIIDMESKETVASNMPGELCFKGPQLMKYYYNNAKATSETLDSEGWLHTGDIGYYNDSGYFYLTDRLKEFIKVNAIQVAPAELEEVLRKHPGVLEAGVVGVSSERTGETPVAFVQTIPGTTVSEEDIKTFVASRLSKHKHLSSVRFVPTIPKTPSGKILRKSLRKLLSDERKSLSFAEIKDFKNFSMCAENI